MDVAERDRRYMAPEGRPEGVQEAWSEGSLVFDRHGKTYVDFTAGWCVGDLGRGNEEILAALRGFNGPAYVHPDCLYRPWSELAEMLAGLTPGKLTKFYRATGGSKAVEITLQVAMAADGREGIVSLEGIYHGDTLGARSRGGDRQTYPNRLAPCHRVEPLLDDWSAGGVEGRLEGEQIAAFVMEPVVCNLGALIPSKEFMTRVREACRRYGTLPVADEVAAGCGRPRKLFASEHFGLDPDVMCLAKAITAWYSPMGATVATAAAGVRFDSSYGWHPLSVAAAIASLKHWGKHESTLLGNVVAEGNCFRTRLTGMKFAEPGAIRVIGLAMGVEFGEGGDDAAKLGDRCRESGLLVSAEAESLPTLFPALTIDPEVARQGVDILEAYL